MNNNNEKKYGKINPSATVDPTIKYEKLQFRGFEWNLNRYHGDLIIKLLEEFTMHNQLQPQFFKCDNCVNYATHSGKANWVDFQACDNCLEIVKETAFKKGFITSNIIATQEDHDKVWSNNVPSLPLDEKFEKKALANGWHCGWCKMKAMSENYASFEYEFDPLKVKYSSF